MPRPDFAFPFFAATAMLTTALLTACSDRSTPARLVAPGSPLRTEVMTAPFVTTLADDGDGTCTDNYCTLRDAIAFASAGATITFGRTGTITLAQGQLAILKNLTISGPGADLLAVDGNHQSREFLVLHADARISGLTMKNGYECCRSPDAFGGGIANFGGTLTLTDVTISGNISDNRQGGGISNLDGVLIVTGSTITGNTSGLGGGIQNYGTATITNSTISGDTATAFGGIGNGGSLTLVNSTVSGNIAYFDAGGIGHQGQTPPIKTTLINTIVANNPAKDGDGNCDRPVETDGGYNIEDGTTCGFTAATSYSNADPLLDPAGLVPNGGATWTIALLPGSPAIDAIPFGTNGCGTVVTTDQRGVTRPFGNGCDVGAYEAVYSTGFLPPINNARTTPIHPGAGVPVQFRLGGYRGLDIFAPGSPNSVGITCPLSAGSGDVLLTDTPGNSGLSYNATTDTYTYVWKTDKAWAGTCRRLVVSFGNGTVWTADFVFAR